MIHTIRTQSDIDAAAAYLMQQDPTLLPLFDAIGVVPLRLREPGFEGLVRIVISQQVSVASATAISSRLSELIKPFTAHSVTQLSDETLLACGLSRPKLKTLRTLSESCLDGFDIEGLNQLSAKNAKDTLIGLHGIGPWTADIFLMFCAGHPDIFPIGDIALQNVAKQIFKLRKHPTEKRLAVLTRRWRPYRSVAARILWAYYGVLKSKSSTDAAASKLPI